jgi:hypothetical protein
MRRDTAELCGPATRRARRMLVLKRTFEVLVWLTAFALFVFAGRAVFACAKLGAPAATYVQTELKGGER